MNGFEIKEEIELTKKRIKEVERDLQRASTVEYGNIEDVKYDKVNRMSFISISSRKEELNRQLAKYEKMQELFNVSTMVKFGNETISLCEAIKYYGMKAKHLTEIEVAISAHHGLPTYNRNLTKDSVVAPFLKAKDTEEELKTLKYSIEKEMSTLKGLIATANSKVLTNM